MKAENTQKVSFCPIVLYRRCLYYIRNVITYYVFCESELNDEINNPIPRIGVENMPTFKSAGLKGVLMSP
jgi:hypothetical protein